MLFTEKEKQELDRAIEEILIETEELTGMKIKFNDIESFNEFFNDEDSEIEL